MIKTSFPARLDNLEQGITFIEDTLKKYNIKKRQILETMLICEEAIVRLMSHSSENAVLEISIRRWYNTARITLSAEGPAFSNDELQLPLTDEISHDSEESIRSILLHAYSDKIVYSRTGKYNFVRIQAGSREPIVLMQTFLAFLVAYLLAMVLHHFFSDTFSNDILEYILVPFQTGFLNALQLITAPAVFFSIMTAVARYTAFSNSGKITAKIMAGYILTSIIAVCLAISLFGAMDLFRNSQGLLSMYVNEPASISDRTTVYTLIVTMIPNNIVGPFMETNAMQLLMMAVLAGIALGRAGHFSPMLREIAEALDRFFSECVNLISKIIPASVFLLTLLMCLYFHEAAFLIALKIAFLTILSIVLMYFVYLLLILIIGRMNPLPFSRKCLSHIWGTINGSNGSNTIQNNIRMCTRKLGIPQALAGFSIPFGALANMDGNCIYLTIAGFSVARLCGVSLFGSRIVTIVLMVIILSIGSAITPASAVLALTMLMNQMSISPMVVSILVGINVIIEIFLAICNVIGDMVITLIVARTENLVNMDTYRKR